MQAECLYHRKDSLVDTQVSKARSVGYTLAPTLPIRMWLTNAAHDPVWDAFVARVRGGQYAQSSLWEQTNVYRGRQVARVLLAQGNQLVGGLQVSLFRVPVVGMIGYVARGPLLAHDDPTLVQMVPVALHHLARACRIRYMLIQPPVAHEALLAQLPQWGWTPADVGRELTCAHILPLAGSEDDLLMGMRKSTRKHVRAGLRHGVTVREGTLADMHFFYELHRGTSDRQQFQILPEAYFTGMWDILYPRGYLRLFLAEHAGQRLSAMLTVPFGDTLYGILYGWSGEGGKYYPNDVLYWEVIRWAKQAGFAACNFEWLDPAIAAEVTQHHVISDEMRHSPTFFKLGFGGNAVAYPGTYEYIAHPMWGHVCKVAVSQFAASSSARNVVTRLLHPFGN